SQKLDAAPDPGVALGPSPHVQSDSRELADRAALAVAERRWEKGSEPGPLEKVRALFDFVDGLDDRPQDRKTDALGCLRAGGGNALARSRLLVALCRSRSLPARLITGLVLSPDQPEPQPHYWAEAWAGRWAPMCPTAH